MKTILFLRHAKSDWGNTNLADVDRPLANSGLKAATRMGKLLAQTDYIPDLIIASPAKRAQQTAELVIEACACKGEIEWQERFYYGGSSDILAGLRNLPDTVERPLIIGHNPTLTEVIGILCHNHAPDDFTVDIQLPAGGLVCLEAHISHWLALNPGDALLRWFIIPKLIKSLL